MKTSIVVFPGSNCDRDIAVSIKKLTRKKPKMVWHKETKFPKSDLIVIPGGFSFGDYLRCGAIASQSPIMKDVLLLAKKGVLVLGICNGFQILIETNLLPGALIRNKKLKFICKDIFIKTSNVKTAFTNKIKTNKILKLPIAHNEGNYFVPQNKLKSLQDNEQIAFSYCDKSGKINQSTNPNGSTYNIAGILNKKKNVLGMMPHPERSADKFLGCEDGKIIFESLMNVA